MSWRWPWVRRPTVARDIRSKTSWMNVDEPKSQRVVNKTELGFARQVCEGDSISAIYDGEEVAHHKVDRSFQFDGVVIHNVEEGEFDENVKDGMGAAFVDLEGKGFKT